MMLYLKRAVDHEQATWLHQSYNVEQPAYTPLPW